MPLAQIIVVPRNGYANRLQTWGSAHALGEHWGVPVALCWEPEAVAPATGDDLFDSSALPDVMAPEELRALLGGAHTSLPRYLTVIPEKNLIVLAGHDRGEQVFMPELQAVVAASAPGTRLLIIAGGHFGIGSEAELRQQRRVFYRSIPWSGDIESRTQILLQDRAPFIGLHVRQTDRSREAPTPKQITAGVQEMHRRTGLRDVFVATDTLDSRQVWERQLHNMGLQPWVAQTRSYERSSTAAGIEAMVEWRILGSASGLIFSAASSFGAEAAVAAGDIPASPLQASAGRQRIRDVGALAQSALSYPKRHGWITSG
jgi:hypothetical protein